jgi:5'-3' exonuclease
MHANIDMDVVLYKCSAGSSYIAKYKIEEALKAGLSPPNYLTLEECIELLVNYIETILTNTKATSYTLWCTPRGKDANFRYKLFPDYKGNRTGEKPACFYDLQKFAEEHYKERFRYAQFAEADDMLGCGASEDSIACTIDKDMQQFPGLHYNLTTGEIINVTYDDAWYNFWKQMLMGDKVDNIPSAFYRCGAKSAEKVLDGVAPSDYPTAVRDAYEDDQQFVINYNLVHLWRKPWQLFDGQYLQTYINEEDFRKELDVLHRQLNA